MRSSHGSKRSVRRGFSLGAGPMLDALEPRRVLSASVSGGVLRIVGSNRADEIEIGPGPGDGQVVVSGVPGVSAGTVFEGVESVDVRLRNGADTFTLSGDLVGVGGGDVPLVVNGGNGSDNVTLFNSAGLSTIIGGNGPDNLTGGDGIDDLRGGNGRDTLRGGGNDDTLSGQNGHDLLVGGGGGDTLLGGNGRDELWGNAGDDLLRGGRGPDILAGGLGVDSLLGERGPDTILGSPGEADDFALPDRNFDALFNPDGFGVLPHNTFWDRFAGTEENGVSEDETLEVAGVLGRAFSGVTGAYRAVVEDIFLMTPSERQDVFQALEGVTNAFSPSVLANPAGFGPGGLTGLRDDLNSAAPAIGSFRDSFIAYNNALFDELLAAPDLVSAINGLEAGSGESQSALFAADSLFNLFDELNQ